jgi:hypothetical protein
MKRVYRKIFPPVYDLDWLDCSGQDASDLIRDRLLTPKPCMISRLGIIEMNTIYAWWEINSNASLISKIARVVRGQIHFFDWDEDLKYSMANNAGFFPTDESHLVRFAERMLADIPQIDILGAWWPGEHRLYPLMPQARRVRLKDLEPYYHANPWTPVLEQKKVLVIHPFEKSIIKQYAIHEKLFKDPRILPDFELLTLKAVQSAAQTRTRFATWFEALDWMCAQINALDFDVAIIGAGAYGLPLAAHIKRLGKKAIQLGGATQILFGIRGRRWDRMPFFQGLYNEQWIRPLPEETPLNFQSVEDGCYW